MRQVRAIAAILARLAGLRLEGRLDEARSGVDEAYSMLLGSQGALIRRVDVATAAKLIGPSEKILSFASILEEEAELEADETRKQQLRGRATELRSYVESKEPR